MANCTHQYGCPSPNVSLWKGERIENRKLSSETEGLRVFLKNLRRPSDNLVETKARIHFPIRVESRFEMYSLGWNDSSAVVFYIILNSPSEQHRVATADPMEVVIC